MVDHDEREQLQKLEDEKNVPVVQQAQDEAQQKEVESEQESSTTDEDVDLDDEGVTY